MRYKSVLFFALTAVALTVYGLLFPGFVIQQVIGNGSSFVLGRLLLAGLLAGYVLFPAMRCRELQLLFRLGGAVLIGYGLAASMSPMLFGLADAFIPIGDVFIWLEGGVLALLLSLDVPLNKIQRTTDSKRAMSIFAAPGMGGSLKQT